MESIAISLLTSGVLGLSWKYSFMKYTLPSGLFSIQLMNLHQMNKFDTNTHDM